MNKNYLVFIFIFNIIFYSSCVTHDGGINNNFKIYENIKLSFIQEDYERKDLLYILGFGSNEETICVWKISSEELDKQECFTFYELVNNIDVNRLINNGNYFLNNYFGGLYQNNMYFYSIEYLTVNNLRYGEDANQKRNDWIIILSFNKYNSTFNEKVLILPDYKIIISSNNYENITFE
jgi:hypothetical protein